MFRDNVGKVDSQCGFVVLYPQHLLSITTITGGLYCKRKSLLNQKFKRIEATNSNLIVGTVAHEVFQRVRSQISLGKEAFSINRQVNRVGHRIVELTFNEFQAVSEKLQRAEIVAVLDEILARSEIVHDLYLLNLSHYEIKASVLQMVPHILSFMRDVRPKAFFEVE